MSNRKQDDRSPPPPLPPFRSVRMTTAGPPSMLRQPLSQGSIPKLPPAQQLNTSHDKTFDAATTPSISISNKTSPKWTWKLEQVQPVPMFHPLERTAIRSSDSLDLITERISGFLKAQSIQCDYHDDMGRVNCSTEYCLHFSVQLWQKDPSTTVIEVQRRQGCAIRMQALRQQLRQSILFGEEEEQVVSSEHKVERTSAFFQQLPVRTEDCLGHCLEVCEQFLSSQFLDQNRLGLESLVVLVDPSKVMATDAQETSRKILQDEGFQQLFLKFLKPQLESTLGHEEMEHGTMHLLTMKVLAKALETSNASVDVNSTFWQAAIEASYKNIQRAHTKPMEAALSIKAVRLLQTREPFTINSMPLSQHLQVAYEYGRKHNNALQKETELLMRMKHVY